MNAAEVVTRLRARFAPPEYALFTDVGDATGGRATRRADAIAMSLWPSRGLELHGFEVKVDRRDWLRELKQPAKAEALARFCDRWWVVVSDDDIVQRGELPPTWGLLVAKGPKLVAKVDAPKLEPQQVTRSFLAAMLRVAQAQSPAEAVLAAARAEGVEEGKRLGIAQAAAERDGTVRRSLALRASVEAFEAKSGVRICEYDGPRLGEAVAHVMRLYMPNEREAVERLRAEARRVASSLDEVLAATEPTPALEVA